MMSTIERDHEHNNEVVIITKGAPGVLLDQCTRARVGMNVVALDDALRARILADIDTLADAALRTLAVAYRPLDPEEDAVAGESLERDLIFVGTARMWVGVIEIGAVVAVTTLLTIDIYLPGGLIEGTHDLATARTVGFTMLVLGVWAAEAQA